MKSLITYIKRAELFKELEGHEGRFYAVIDTSLKNHLPLWMTSSPRVFWLKDPEAEKNLETFARAAEFFLKEGVNRSSVIHAIGGGATTDLAGFVAATVLRGIRWVSVPTTLLAMVDGSIGGKVAVNMPQGKNLVGAFHLPEKVYICDEFLSSLPGAEWTSGKGEVLKYGFLSQEINQLILRRAGMDEIVSACARFKNDVVEKDLHEKGERIYLNLGHTLGHAFESNLKIPHGQAVTMGLRYLFILQGLSEALAQWEKMLLALDLDPRTYDLKNYDKFDIEAFLSYLSQDKKKIESGLRLVLPKEIGTCYVEEVSLKEFVTKIKDHAAFSN